MSFYKIVVLGCILVLSFGALAQTSSRQWNGKKCAVVLTYDDALNVHLDKVIPALDAFKFKGTFYLVGSSPVVSKRLNEWRAAAKKGHELGNHTLNHPCDGTFAGRDFVTPEADLSKFSVARAINEIKVTNTILEAIDGKKERTFAYPCGDRKIGDVYYYDLLKEDFVAARGVESGLLQKQQVDLANINCFGQSESTAVQMIAQIEAAEKAGSFAVLLFHGVGGEHGLNVSVEEHQKVLAYLKKREKDIWVATMVEVANYIKKSK